LENQKYVLKKSKRFSIKVKNTSYWKELKYYNYHLIKIHINKFTTMLRRIIVSSLIALTIVFTTYSQEPSSRINSEKIMTQLTLDANGKTEVIKNFPESFPEELITRGKPIVYTRKNSNNFDYIGMPIGGIGAGQLYMGGDGQLWGWNIFGVHAYQFDLRGDEAYVFPLKKSARNEYGARWIDQGFSISMQIEGKKVTKKLNQEGFTNIEFLGQYPIAQVTYHDEDFPVKVKLEAFSPFTPLDVKNSMYPATVLIYTVKNASSEKVELDLKGWLDNAVLVSGRKNEKVQGELVNSYKKTSNNGIRLECSVENANDFTRQQCDYGTMSLSVINPGGEVFCGDEGRIKLAPKTKLLGEIGARVELKPGEDKQVSFLLTWHFPKTYAVLSQRGRLGDQYFLSGDTTRYYAELYPNAFAVSDTIIKEQKKLTENTFLWRDTWYNSTLPYWFLDRTFANTSTLATITSSLLNDGMFYGHEGANQGPGTCIHVWGYAQAPGRLFPDLEKSLREKVDFKPFAKGGAMEENGVVKTRWRHEGLTVDGQSGIIMRTYLTHQMSKDYQFLKRNYVAAKKVMNALINLKDADHNGMLSGAQFNTLDGGWYGDIPWLSLYYTAALRSMAKMADEVGDSSFSKYCVEIAEKGKNYIEDNLFNGEYFIHKGDPEHPHGPGTYKGLEYSQLMGQSWAYQVGLGEIIDPEKVSKTLESMWRYNFTTDVGPFRAVQKGGRWYAMPGEGGLIACTWPNGGKEVLDYGYSHFANYNNECQNGYEYAATSLMMWHGMPYHSLAHIWYMNNNRYHGSRRNPYCEVEWGMHYARSMASYGHFIAVSGFEYHGPNGYMAFSPKITPENFKSAFTAAEGWGTFEQKQEGNKQTNSISVAYGELMLNILVLRVNDHLTAKDLKVSKNGKMIKCDYQQNKDRVHITFKDGELVNADETLIVLIR
jgi:uncharacterized protein (DUF608 family)